MSFEVLDDSSLAGAFVEMDDFSVDFNFLFVVVFLSSLAFLFWFPLSKRLKDVGVVRFILDLAIIHGHVNMYVIQYSQLVFPCVMIWNK